MTTRQNTFVSDFIMIPPFPLQPQVSVQPLQPALIQLMPVPVVIVSPYSGPFAMYRAICQGIPMNTPTPCTNPHPIGLQVTPVDQTETKTESRDAATFVSKEKSTQLSQLPVGEECVNQDPQGGTTVDCETVDNAEKIQRNPDTDLSENEELQNEEDCFKEVGNGSLVCITERPSKPVEASLISSTTSPASNDTKIPLAGESSRMILPLATKRILAVNGETMFLSRGMEKKFGFKKIWKTRLDEVKIQ